MIFSEMNIICLLMFALNLNFYKEFFNKCFKVVQKVKINVLIKV